MESVKDHPINYLGSLSSQVIKSEFHLRAVLLSSGLLFAFAGRTPLPHGKISGCVCTGAISRQCVATDETAPGGSLTRAYFAEDPSVFTYSIHVGKNYPAKKEIGDCDVPLPRYASGELYLDRLAATLPEVFAQTEPDLVFWISGADPHIDDRFGQMQLTDASLALRDEQVLNLCKAYATNLVLLYGGGYNRVAGKTGELHAATVLRTHAFFDRVLRTKS